ncbi:MAG: Na/Pi cotransporter family protein [Spirochaetales bacterium]|nr:Na/Pi cotransporter family protein [Spirochaetales bacterium]
MTLFQQILNSLLQLLGALGLFLLGMRMMSDGLQKASSDRMEAILNGLTSNRFMALFTGFIVTAIIQSSSATTVMVVGFVNAGLMTLVQSIGVIMGANIGTTITGWLVSILGFKVSMTSLSIPIIGIGMPLFFSKNSKRRHWGEVILGFGLLFLGLSYMKGVFPKPDAESISFLAPLSSLGFLSTILFVLAGTLLTIIVHSSSASMAITLTLAYGHVIPFESAAAMILGSNIGTTIDALLAGIGARLSARRTAMVHILFNIAGSIVALIFFKPYLALACAIIPGDDITAQLAAFHTLFNIINTVLFIGFVPQIAKLVEKIVRKDGRDEDEDYSIEYMDITLQNVSDFNMLRGRKEVSSMIDKVDVMFNNFMSFIKEPKNRVNDILEEQKRQEHITDLMEEELTKFFILCSAESQDKDFQNKITALIRIVNELESIGDSCYNLMIFANKMQEKKIKCHKDSFAQIEAYGKDVQQFLILIKEYDLDAPDEESLKKAYELEKVINKQRKDLKKRARKLMNSGENIKGELLFIDMVRYIEQIGDYCLNIAEALKEGY